MSYRDEYIQGLRDLADFLEVHPDVDIWRGAAYTLNLFVNTKEELLDVRRRVGATEKTFGFAYFHFDRKFGPHSIQVNIQRNQLCHRVVTKKIVPAEPEQLLPARPEREVEEVSWECPDSVLEPDHAAEKATTQE